MLKGHHKWCMELFRVDFSLRPSICRCPFRFYLVPNTLFRSVSQCISGIERKGFKWDEIKEIFFGSNLPWCVELSVWILALTVTALLRSGCDCLRFSAFSWCERWLPQLNAADPHRSVEVFAYFLPFVQIPSCLLYRIESSACRKRNSESIPLLSLKFRND